jgi:ferric-dicitrate binding protein FerR (iron transport regulator)
MLIATFAFTMVAIVPAARAQTTIGTITQIQGVANIQRGALNLVAAPNIPVMLNDKITTQPGATLTIGLVDNSSLQLGSDSAMTIDESVLVNGVGAPSKVGLLNGKLHSVIVGAMRGSTTTFEVHTPTAVGAVRGTEFSTDSEDGKTNDKYKDCVHWTEWDVQDGTVQVCSTQTPPKCEDCHAGHQCTVACGVLYLDGAEVGAAGGIGAAAATAIGVGIVAGGVVGGIAASGGFDSGSGNGPPVSPHK